MRLLLLGRSLLTSGLLTALLVAPASSAQPQDRADLFDRFADSVRFAQNPDGGWGPQTAGGDPDTAKSPQTFALTAWASTTLLDLGADPSWTWPNRGAVLVSLANSTTPNALDWLHRAEPSAPPSSFADAALVAAAYARLGDDVNGRRVADDVVRLQAANGTWGDAAETARVLMGLESSDLADAETPEAERMAAGLERAEAHLVGLAPDERDERGLAWTAVALFARGHEASLAFGDELANRTLPADDEVLAVSAWALAATSHERAADVVLDALATRPLGGVPRLLAIEAMATRHPELLQDERQQLATIALSSGVGGPFRTIAITPASLLADLKRDVENAQNARLLAEQERATLQARESRLSNPSGEFPLPAGFVAATSLVFLAALTVFGLAIGLHRETLGGSRKEIFEYIEAHPGEHLNQIRRDLDVSPGAAMYHLHALEREGWVTSHRDARYKRFYVNGNKVQQLLQGRDYKEKHAALMNETARALVQFVRDHPGVGQKLVSEALGLHPSTVNWHVNRLKEAGVLVDTRVGREVRYNVEDPSGVDKVLKKMRETPSGGAEPPPGGAA